MCISKISDQRILFLFLSLVIISSQLCAAEIYSKSIGFEGGQIKIYTPDSALAHPKVALVLSGGGARGMAHIGVLKALEKNQIPIDLIVGTSIGSVVGGLYAVGYSPDQIARITKSIDWPDIYSDETQRSSLFLGQKSEQDRYLAQLRFKKGNPFIPIAYTAGQKVLNILSDLFLQAQYQSRNDFDNLRVPFRVVCTDLVSGKLVVLKKGNLAESINASLAIPLLFTPVEIDSMLLVDGGLMSNLPVDAARAEGMDVVIAVDATSHLRPKDDIDAPWKIVDQGTTIMSNLSTKMQEQRADLVLRPDLKELPNDDFKNIDDIISIGERAVEQNLAALKKLTQPAPSGNEYKYLIRRLLFAGGDSILPFEIYHKLTVKTGQQVACRDIRNDLDTFINSGWYKDVRVEVYSDSGGVQLSWRLRPFAKIRLIEFTGHTKYPTDTLQFLLFNQPGQKLNTVTLQQDLARLTELYRRDGYSLMRINRVDWNDDSGHLHIEIDEGKISELLIKGRGKTRRYVILREFGAIKGHVFNWRTVQRAIQNIYATQFYERVNVDIVEQADGNNLIVKVREKPSVLLRLGGKYDSDRKAQAYLEFGDESFLGMGVKTMLVSRLGMRDGHIGLKIRDDRIFTTYLTIDLQGYYTWQNNPFKGGRYREERRGARLQVGQQMRRLGQLVMELRHEHVDDMADKGLFPYVQNVELRTFALRAVTDKRDRNDFPTKGIYNHWAWETGSDLILVSPEAYTKALVNLEGYYTFNNLHTWHFKLFVGLGDKTMPFAENFRIGGLHSFYGLTENEYFGKQLFVSSAEYRIKLPWRIKNNLLLKDSYISTRYDFGGVWKDPDLTFTSNDFFSGVGAFVGFDTILGPLYFGYGQTTRGNAAAYFSLGFSY